MPLCEDRRVKGDELSAVFVAALQELMNHNDRVVCLEADLGGASKTSRIHASHPQRYVQCGISEANMMGVAAGLSATGYIPFAHTFGPFATRRACDQIFLSGAYAGNTINIYGSDPGFAAGPNGGTHTTYEDISILRAIPRVTILDAADAVQLEWIVRAVADRPGVNYFRANRKAVRNVYAPGTTFEIGKGVVTREGDDVLIVTAGQIISDALDCAEMLADEGISCEVLDMFTIKPFDSELLLERAAGKKAVVSFENHSIYGGLGSAVAETLAESPLNPVFRRHGVNDRFGQVGSQDFLQAEYGLCAEHLADTVRQVMSAV